MERKYNEKDDVGFFDFLISDLYTTHTEQPITTPRWGSKFSLGFLYFMLPIVGILVSFGFVIFVTTKRISL